MHAAMIGRATGFDSPNPFHGARLIRAPSVARVPRFLWRLKISQSVGFLSRRFSAGPVGGASSSLQLNVASSAPAKRRPRRNNDAGFIMPILGLSLRPAVSYYSFAKFMFLPSAKVKPFGTLIVSRRGGARVGEEREAERRERERERRRDTDDRRTMKLCANSPCMDSGEAGSLSIRPSASLAATKSATGPR